MTKFLLENWSIGMDKLIEYVFKVHDVNVTIFSEIVIRNYFSLVWDKLSKFNQQWEQLMTDPEEQEEAFEDSPSTEIANIRYFIDTQK